MASIKNNVNTLIKRLEEPFNETILKETLNSLLKLSKHFNLELTPEQIGILSRLYILFNNGHGFHAACNTLSDIFLPFLREDHYEVENKTARGLALLQNAKTFDALIHFISQKEVSFKVAQILSNLINICPEKMQQLFLAKKDFSFLHLMVSDNTIDLEKITLLKLTQNLVKGNLEIQQTLLKNVDFHIFFNKLLVHTKKKNLHVFNEENSFYISETILIAFDIFFTCLTKDFNDKEILLEISKNAMFIQTLDALFKTISHLKIQSFTVDPFLFYFNLIRFLQNFLFGTDTLLSIRLLENSEPNIKSVLTLLLKTANFFSSRSIPSQEMLIRSSLKISSRLVLHSEKAKTDLVAIFLDKADSLKQPAIIFVLCVALRSPLEAFEFENLLFCYFHENPVGQKLASLTFPSANGDNSHSIAEELQDAGNPRVSHEPDVSFGGNLSSEKRSYKRSSFGEIIIEQICSFYDLLTKKRDTNAAAMGEESRATCSAIRILSFVLKDNAEVKEKLLSLKTHCEGCVFLPRLLMEILFHSSEELVKKEILIAMCFWFVNSPKSVRAVFRAPRKYFPKLVSLFEAEFSQTSTESRLGNKSDLDYKKPCLVEDLSLKGLAALIIFICIKVIEDLALPPTVLEPPCEPAENQNLLCFVVEKRVGAKDFERNVQEIKDWAQKAWKEESGVENTDFDLYCKIFTEMILRETDYFHEKLEGFIKKFGSGSASDVRLVNGIAQSETKNGQRGSAGIMEQMKSVLKMFNQQKVVLKETMEENDALTNDNFELRLKVKELQLELKENFRGRNKQKKILKNGRNKLRSHSLDSIFALNTEAFDCSNKHVPLSEYERVKTDVHDLLILVGQQEVKMDSLKEILKNNGIEAPADIFKSDEE